ncbi:hypothetical protein MAR_023256 [Mya arenaria]|uniref:Uncharacterized protein n=1 Tax=Mya arenaria TaxID=6604 RepID=A0ABY7DP43_MYAAR|nr:hypothetical protein MAR_023256 [Mya arenaria]
MPENKETYAKYRETSGLYLAPQTWLELYETFDKYYVIALSFRNPPGRFVLDPGEYIPVPTKQLPNQERSYFLRLFSVGAI